MIFVFSKLTYKERLMSPAMARLWTYPRDGLVFIQHYTAADLVYLRYENIVFLLVSFFLLNRRAIWSAALSVFLFRHTRRMSIRANGKSWLTMTMTLTPSIEKEDGFILVTSIISTYALLGRKEVRYLKIDRDVESQVAPSTPNGTVLSPGPLFKV